MDEHIFNVFYCCNPLYEHLYKPENQKLLGIIFYVVNKLQKPVKLKKQTNN